MASPCSASARSLAAAQSSDSTKNHATPHGTKRSAPDSASSSRQSPSARFADSVYQASGPWENRSSRFSPPEAARTCPGAYCSTSVTSQPLPASRWAREAPKTPAPTMTALLDVGLDHRIALDPPRGQLPGVGPQDQVRPVLPEPRVLDVDARRPWRRVAVGVKDGELVPVVLQEPDLGRDLEAKPVRRRLRVPAALVPDGLTVAQDDQPTSLVRRLLSRVLQQLGADLGRNPQRAPPQNST